MSGYVRTHRQLPVPLDSFQYDLQFCSTAFKPSDPLAPRKNCAANPTMLALLKLCCQPQPRLLCENRAANNTPLAL